MEVFTCRYFNFKKKLDDNFKVGEIQTHLQTLEDIEKLIQSHQYETWPKSHLLSDVMQLPEEFQKEFLKIKVDPPAKDNLHLSTLDKIFNQIIHC